MGEQGIVRLMVMADSAASCAGDDAGRVMGFAAMCRAVSTKKKFFPRRRGTKATWKKFFRLGDGTDMSRRVLWPGHVVPAWGVVVLLSLKASEARRASLFFPLATSALFGKSRKLCPVDRGLD